MTKKQRKRGKEHYKKGDRYNAQTSELIEEELKLKCENKLLRRAKSLMLQKEIYILQKLQGMKIQQRKRKTKRKKLESIIIKLDRQANRKRNRKTTIMH